LVETTACQEATKIEPDPGLMQSIKDHQEIPKEDAAVMPVGGSRERRRVCYLAAERLQKRKERARGNRGYMRKLVAACRKMPRRAKVAWRKRNLFRSVQTKKLWTAEEIDRHRHKDDPLCKSGTA
jgi:hypothetical protein